MIYRQSMFFWFAKINRGEKYMKKEEILNNVLNYINDDEIKYAILINGAWGSGKTYLYENYLINEIKKVECGKNKRKSNVYISLYGVSNIESLAKELLANYMVQNKRLNKKAYEVTTEMASIISKFVSFSSNFASFSFEQLTEIFSEKISIKDMVICFDDFERCSIPINELFGFINNLVEHCHCKVIILADEDNIGKIFANTNIEKKYITLLLGKKLVGKVDDKGNKSLNNTNKRLTIEQLKKQNEELYSENYVYKDIKEKVIGLTITYEPNLDEEIENIIKITVKNARLRQKMIIMKKDILKYMRQYKNSNIRIIQTWLTKFEEIFQIIEKDYSNSKHFENIFNEFMIYSIRVACAVGKNKRLTEWKEDTEYAYVNIDDGVLEEKEGYRFIDDQYLKNEIDKMRVFKAANYIDNKCIIKEKTSSKGEMLDKLEDWKIYEDDEIREMVKYLMEEIKEDKYVPQNYQYVIQVLVILSSMKLCGDELEKISNILLDKVKESDERREIQNFGLDFQNEEMQRKFHEYYDPIYNLLIQKNRTINNAEINKILDSKDVNKFIDYCQKNPHLFLHDKLFEIYIDLEKFITFLRDCSLKDIYRVIRVFQEVHNNIDPFDSYKGDVNAFEELKKKVNDIGWSGITRIKARDSFCNVLDLIIKRIKNQD